MLVKKLLLSSAASIAMIVSLSAIADLTTFNPQQQNINELDVLGSVGMTFNTANFNYYPTAGAFTGRISVTTPTAGLGLNYDHWLTTQFALGANADFLYQNATGSIFLPSDDDGINNSTAFQSQFFVGPNLKLRFGAFDFGLGGGFADEAISYTIDTASVLNQSTMGGYIEEDIWYHLSNRIAVGLRDIEALYAPESQSNNNSSAKKTYKGTSRNNSILASAAYQF